MGRRSVQRPIYYPPVMASTRVVSLCEEMHKCQAPLLLVVWLPSVNITLPRIIEFTTTRGYALIRQYRLLAVNVNIRTVAYAYLFTADDFLNFLLTAMLTHIFGVHNIFRTIPPQTNLCWVIKKITVNRYA